MTDRRSVRRGAAPEPTWVEPWLAHDCPERHFDHGTWIDDCRGCVLALRAEAFTRPRLVLCIKTDADRILVTAEYAAEVLADGRPLEELCYVAGDRVREVFVPAAASLDPSERWWSLTAVEETTRSVMTAQRPSASAAPDQRPGRGGLDIRRRSPTSPGT